MTTDGQRPPTTRELVPPGRALDLELSGPDEPIDDARAEGGRYGWAIALVRLHSQPLGSVVLELPAGGLAGPAARDAAVAALGPEIAAHLASDGLPPDALRGSTEVPAPDEAPRCRLALASFLAAAPPLTVVIASRDRPERVAACVAAVLATGYPGLEVIVVDNAPTTDATRRVVASRFHDRPEVRYLREDRPGTSRARNRGLRAASTELVAFLDDDVVVDRDWAAAIARPLVEDGRVACVTGLIVGAEFETEPQVWIEEYGGFAKGFQPVVHELGGERREGPLFPYAAGALGSGASMAFRRSVLVELGGFDPALGGGTPARGGEDLSPFVEVLLSGRRLAYEPAAVARHFHHRSYDDLRRVMVGYGSGLSAYLTRTVVHHPERLPGIARRAITGGRYLLDPRSAKNVRKRGGYPPELTRAELRGIACGPVWYAQGVLAARRRPRARPANPRTPGRA